MTVSPDRPSLPPRRDLTDGIVLLRAPVPGDAEAIRDGASDPETVRWTRVPTPYSLEIAATFVEEIAGWWAEGSACVWAVCAADRPEELLGCLGLHDVDLTGEPGGTAEIGYWMRPVGRGRGLMTRAVRVATAFAVDELGMTRVQWAASVGNEASRRVAEGNGYVVEGLLRRGMLNRGVRDDVWIGGILAEELPRG